MTRTAQRQPSAIRRLGPGAALTLAAVAVATALAKLVPAMSALTVAVVLGVAVGNLPRLPASVRPGLAWSMRKLLRLGVVVLGLRLAVNQIAGLGAGTVLAVLLIVVVTFLGTLLAGHLLGTGRGLSLLVATGFSICGASAIAAVESVVDREDENVATGVALVTIFGTLAMLLLPAVATGLGVSDVDAGRIAGGSVHEVAQVVAAASPAGSTAVSVAVVVKLTRVVLLAPLVTIISLAQRRATRGASARPPLVPLFVLGFLAAVALRSTGLLPAPVLSGAQQLSDLLLTGALFALGTSVQIPVLIRTGPKAFLLGSCSTLLAAGTAIPAVLALS